MTKPDIKAVNLCHIQRYKQLCEDFFFFFFFHSGSWLIIVVMFIDYYQYSKRLDQWKQKLIGMNFVALIYVCTKNAALLRKFTVVVRNDIVRKQAFQVKLHINQFGWVESSFRIKFIQIQFVYYCFSSIQHWSIQPKSQ